MDNPILRNTARCVLFTLISCLLAMAACAAEPSEDYSLGRIIYVDQEKNFAIINLGQDEGVVKGIVFDVYRQDEKVGAIKVVKIRGNFSAADVELTYKNNILQVGDKVIPSQKTKAMLKSKEAKFLRHRIDTLFNQAETELRRKQYQLAEDKVRQVLELEPDNQRAALMLNKIALTQERAKTDEIFREAQNYLQAMEYALAQEKIEQILFEDPQNERAQDMLKEAQRGLAETVGLKPEIITVDIKAPKQVIYSTAIEVLNKGGFFVTFSDPKECNLQAFKNIGSPHSAEWGPVKRSKVYYTLEVKETPESQQALINRLSICFKAEDSQEGEEAKYKIEQDTLVYKEAQKAALSIKCLAEDKKL